MGHVSSLKYCFPVLPELESKFSSHEINRASLTLRVLPRLELTVHPAFMSSLLVQFGVLGVTLASAGMTWPQSLWLSSVSSIAPSSSVTVMRALAPGSVFLNTERSISVSSLIIYGCTSLVTIYIFVTKAPLSLPGSFLVVTGEMALSAKCFFL